MRYPLYLTTIASCLVLVGLFYDRGSYWAAAIAGAAGIFYAWRLLAAARQPRPTPAESDSVAGPPSAERARLIASLQARRKAYDGNRARLTLIAIAIGLTGLTVWIAGNGAFASAISIINLPVLWLVWRNSKAIRIIDQGLAGRAPEAPTG